ncbi:hypothetical protein MKX01_035304 [Papaver californicum]|nr:hypothetical protein MKX01_029760 [Papaver californicum]KAI3987497.1 hypothetical protein MKX01_035304 [Papaver californicum]
MAKTTSLFSSPLFLGLLFISIVLMSSEGVNGDTYRIFLSYEVHDFYNPFKPTKCACCFDNGIS